MTDEMARLRREAVSGKLEKDRAALETLFHFPENQDIQLREIQCQGSRVCAVFMDGMVRSSQVDDCIVRAVQRAGAPMPEEGRGKYLITQVLNVAQAQAEAELGKICDGVLGGMTAVLAEGAYTAVLLDTRGFEKRGVEKAGNESVVLGAQEGFTESIRTNLTLLRRYYQSADLVTEMLSVGTEAPLKVAVVSVEGITNPRALEILRKRLKKIRCGAVHGIGQLQQLIEDSPWALVPQMLMTERPDRAAAALSDGQFVVVADCSPYALIAPCSFFSLLQASDDAFSRWQYGSYMRVVRFLGMLISLLLPGLYLALTEYHTFLIPVSLLTTIAETRANVPLPVYFEMLLMELSFFMINEANLRIPGQIGTSIGIIGALVLGQTAAEASIISPILIIIIAISGLGCYCMPSYSFTITLILYRLGIEALCLALGLYGLCLAVALIVCQVCSLQSFGWDFMTPLAPHRPHNPDLIVRLPAFLQRKRVYARRGEKT